MIQLEQNTRMIKKTALEKQVAMQCAPLLAGIKISNLLIVSTKNWREVVGLFHKTGISFRAVYVSKSKISFLVYRKRQLEAYLNTEEVNELMKELGYQTRDLGQILWEFSLRYKGFMNKEGVFPHEMGLLLGYPVADVEGFMKNQGQNYLYSGYWKVYDNLTEAMNQFNRYKQAKESVLQLMNMGVSIQDIIEGYSCFYTNQLA
jgi:hypothetical protein